MYRWVQYKKYSGLRRKGAVHVRRYLEEGARPQLHMRRAWFLTAMLEAPFFGSVQSYDGCGMSAGPLHNIAVYPRNLKQGSLFPLLRRLELVGDVTALEVLYDGLREEGWYVARDGKLRHAETGAVIGGRAIRNLFTPVNGVVPRKGPARDTATMWIDIFWRLFSDPTTFPAQEDFAIDYLVSGHRTLESQVYAGDDPQVLLVGSTRSETTITPPLDLAMCVYHAYSVNAPALASRALSNVMARAPVSKDPEKFAKALIHRLGTTKYGRWHDTPDGRNRYDKTRLAARRLGFWDKSLVDYYMPRDF